MLFSEKQRCAQKCMALIPQHPRERYSFDTAAPGQRKKGRKKGKGGAGRSWAQAMLKQPLLSREKGEKAPD